MSDAVVIALIGLLGTSGSIVLTAIVNGKLRGIRRQVANDHKTNLRDDLDDKHDELVTLLRRDVGGMRQDIRQQRTDFSELAEIVYRHILDTTPRKEPP